SFLSSRTRHTRFPRDWSSDVCSSDLRFARDVYTVDLATDASKRLTKALNPAIDEADLVASEVIRYPSFDSLEIPSIQFRPKGASASHKVPVLVFVHGGPGRPSRTSYSRIITHLV